MAIQSAVLVLDGGNTLPALVRAHHRHTAHRVVEVLPFADHTRIVWFRKPQPARDVLA